MTAASNKSLESEAPLYVRWGPSGSPYALELKLDLVARIREMLTSDAGAPEIGGLLVGSLAAAQGDTLRIEDIELIRQERTGGVTFMIDPSHETRFEEIDRNARAIGRSIVGVFRSHKRPGALRPSLADRSLVLSLFNEKVAALLLVEASEPFSAAFFVGENRQLPAEPSVKEFRFDEREFKRLPEVEPEAATPQSPRKQRKAEEPKRSYLPVWAVVILLAIVLIWFYGESVTEAIISIRWLPSSPLAVALKPEGPGLRVSWNHSASELQHASGARLTIRRANAEDRELRLGPDELRLGAVAIENSAPRVEVIIAVEIPGSPNAVRVGRWSRP